MNNLFIINEGITNGYKVEILNIIFIFAVLCGIFVIISKNPIVSVLFLIGLFFCVSSNLIILGMSFIGLSYLIVYIGAVSILFLFILMLINIRISELQSNTGNSIPIATSIVVLFSISVFQILPYEIAILNNYKNSLNNMLYNILLNKNNEDSNIIENNVLFVTSKTWDGNLAEVGHITSIGNVMYTNYSIWLIMASFILLLAMVGSIVITIKQKNE
jgi:NADH-ubiquinone oxidoreductase chain 6